MIAGEVSARSGHEGGEPGEEVEGLEEEVGDACGVWMLQRVAELAVVGDGEAIDGQGRSCDVAAQALEFVAFMGLTGDGGVEGEAVAGDGERRR